MATRCGGRSKSNLESFLDSVTPFVPSHILPKSWCRDVKNLWQLVGKDSVEFFILGDLWDQYYEWSAYGAGVPVHLRSGEMVVQYYVPYLSGIQLYTRKPLTASSIDAITSNGIVSQNLAGTDAASEGLGLCNKDPWGTGKNTIGHLYLEFFEGAPPYARVPLLDKVLELSQTHPNLISSRSIELSPASWMSVAWYPIYHIPTRSVRELSASFLTFHTLSSLVQDDTPGSTVKDPRTTQVGEKGTDNKEKSNCISLRPFGLATYKLQGTLWTPPQSRDWETISTLYNAADSWLKQLKVKHHDFTYFSSHFV